MRRQTRPFIVEVKHRRAPTKKQSIWGNLNIAAVTAETMRDLEQDEPTSRPLIDSGALAIDVASDDNPPVEHKMPDPQEAETAEALTEVPAGVKPHNRRKGLHGRRRRRQHPGSGSQRKPRSQDQRRQTLSPRRRIPSAKPIPIRSVPRYTRGSRSRSAAACQPRPPSARRVYRSRPTINGRRPPKPSRRPPI